MSNIIQDAKYKIYNSEIILYVSPEKIEEAFSKIHLIKDREEYLRIGGISKDDRLEGVNKKEGSYLGPDATVHTVIHEVLHDISSEFDEQGHRIKNGIMGDEKLQFANQVNEGLTDYLAAKLSGEDPRHYIQGHKLFSRLEPMIIKYTNNLNALMEIYLTNDVQFLHDFLNYYGKNNTFENLYENFLFMDDKKLNDMLDKVEKNLNKDLKKKARKQRIDNLINKAKNVILRRKLLTDGNEHYHENSHNDGAINSHKQFADQYNIENFESKMTQEDNEKYEEYQQKYRQGNEQQSENEIYEE